MLIPSIIKNTIYFDFNEVDSFLTLKNTTFYKHVSLCSYKISYTTLYLRHKAIIALWKQKKKKFKKYFPLFINPIFTFLCLD